MRSVVAPLLLVLALLGAPTLASAQIGFPCPGSYPPLVGKAHEQLTISTVAKSLTQATYIVSGQVPLAAQLTVITAAINAIDDGTPATAAIGQVVSPGTTFWACSGSVGRLSMIRNGGTDATVNVIFYYAP